MKKTVNGKRKPDRKHALSQNPLHVLRKALRRNFKLTQDEMRH
nr:MAG TPA_asm: hypothetical protein [Caudoviricetes sp.]